jgi:hypothetical protein
MYEAMHTNMTICYFYQKLTYAMMTLGLKVGYIFGSQVLFKSLWFFCYVVINVTSLLRNLIIRFLGVIMFLLFMFHQIATTNATMVLVNPSYCCCFVLLAFCHFTIVGLLLQLCLYFIMISMASIKMQLFLHYNCSCIVVVLALLIILCHAYQ